MSYSWKCFSQWHPTPVLLPGKSHGWRSLVGCSPWGCWGSDTTERLHSHFSLSCFGEGNGNPLQCSCLENPRDGEAWWAAIYGVTQSQTRLKWLSSSREMNKFLESYSLPTLSQKAIDNLNRLIIRSKITSLVKIKLPGNETPGWNGSTGEYYQTY